MLMGKIYNVSINRSRAAQPGTEFLIKAVNVAPLIASHTFPIDRIFCSPNNDSLVRSC